MLKKEITKLDIGCGAKCKPGYTGIDIDGTIKGIDIESAAKDIEEFFTERSVDEIYCRHCLEHMVLHDAMDSLKVFFKILKSGAMLKIIVPNAEYHAKQLLSPNVESEMNPNIMSHEHALAGFYGWQKGPNDFHYWAYTPNYLKSLLLSAGFSVVNKLEGKPWDLGFTCYK